MAKVTQYLYFNIKQTNTIASYKKKIISFAVRRHHNFLSLNFFGNNFFKTLFIYKFVVKSSADDIEVCITVLCGFIIFQPSVRLQY